MVEGNASLLNEQWTTDWIGYFLSPYDEPEGPCELDEPLSTHPGLGYPYVNGNLIQEATGSYLVGPYDFDSLLFGETLKRLSEFDGYSFYVDKDSELHYFKPSNTEVIEVTESNIYDYSPFTKSDTDLTNYVIVKGKGFTIEYSSASSINKYGRQMKVLENPLIIDSDDAYEMASSYLRTYSEPVLNGTVTILGNENIDLHDGINFDLPNLEVSGTYDIKSYTHKVDKEGFYTTIDYGVRQYDPMKDLQNIKTNVSQVSESTSVASPGIEGSVIYKSGNGYGGSSIFHFNENTRKLQLTGRLDLRDSYQSIYITNEAGDDASTASYNVALGYLALRNITTGDNNTALGYRAGAYTTTGSDNVFIGSWAGRYETGSNKLYIAKSDTSYPLIYGEFDNDVVKLGNHSDAWNASLYCGNIYSVGDFSSSRGLYAQWISSSTPLGDAASPPVKSIQFNYDDGLSGSTNFLWDKDYNDLTISGNIYHSGNFYMRANQISGIAIPPYPSSIANKHYVDYRIPTDTQPSKLAGAIWSSGNTEFSQLYYCTSNGGSWKPVTFG